MKCVVFLTACCCVTFSANGFVSPTTTCRHAYLSTSTTRLYSSTETKEKVVELKEEPLSDLDARVLKEMLQKDKLNVSDEENLKKLLERGVAPKSAPSFEKEEPDNSDSPYVSTVFKTIADTKLWKGLQRDAKNIMESVGIFVSNRIERDVQLLASVGVFAWERAVRDVARALPSSGTSGAAVGRAIRQAARQLGNSSSYNEMQEQQTRTLQEMDDLYEELNTPMDEIRSVTQSIRDILKGDSVAASTGRGLRSVAPAGQGQNAERQQRAYRRRKMSTLKQEREVLNLQRAAGTVVDTAAELRRELQVESSKPGYRTEGARKAIAAGAVETKRFLEAAKKDGWRRALFASKERKEDNIRELVGSDDIETIKQEVDAQAVAQLLEEQLRVVERLNRVIHYPSETWLTPEIVMTMNGNVDEDALREVVTQMICVRDDLEVADETDSVSLSAPEMVEKLRKVKSSVDSISSLAAACAGMPAAERLRNMLYGQEEKDASNRPSLLTLDNVEPSIAAAVEIAESLPEVKDDVRVVDAEVFSDTVERTVFAEVVSDGHDRVSSTSKVAGRRSASSGQEIYVTDFHKQTMELKSQTGGASYDPNVKIASVELISDDDFDSAFGAKSVAVSDSEEEENKKEDDMVSVILLRGFDVLFFVLEKIFTSAIPNAFRIGSTVTTRLANVARDGMGSKGWKKLENTLTGSKRY